MIFTEQTTRLLNSSREILALPQVQYRLGEGVVRKLVRLVNHVKPVEGASDGYLDFGNVAKDDIPLAVLRVGEMAVMNGRDMAMHPLQQRAIANDHGANFAQYLADTHPRYFTEHNKHTHGCFPDSGRLAQVAVKWRIKKDNTSAVVGRPLLMLNGDYAQQTGGMSPLALLHEVVHVGQFLESPIIEVPFNPSRYEVRNELEAYTRVAEIILGCRDSGYRGEFLVQDKDIDHTLRVWKLWKETQPNTGDPYEPNDHMIGELVRHKMPITPRLKEVIRSQHN